MTIETDLLGHTTSYAYDAVGDLTKTTDRDGRVILYGYDADGRETTETWVGSSPAEKVTMTYDAAGRPLPADRRCPGSRGRRVGRRPGLSGPRSDRGMRTIAA